ncbi:hypothetical protein, partial [Salmonella enterica]
SRGNSTGGSNPPLSANHSTKSITDKAFLISSYINPCIKISFIRSIFLTTDAVFYHFAARRASTFIFFSSQAHTLLQRPSHISGDKTV